MATHVLCTGGAGYIGSHTVLHLLEAGFNVTVLDNFSNACQLVVQRLEQISGRKIPIVNVDLCDSKALNDLFASHKFDAVIHFAAFKSVGESVAQPLKYYENNIGGTVKLLQAMQAHNVKTIVFSSSATVYKPKETPLNETDPLGASNPYGQTKVMMEQALLDLFVSDSTWKISILRYFNPVGAHPSGLIGESPSGTPANLLPFIQQVAVGRLPALRVFGDNWPTRDGTGVRDYLHVEDLALGHIAALKQLGALSEGACKIYNLGTGKGVSVLEMVKQFEEATGQKIPYEIVAQRPGDLATVVADPSKAEAELHWKATRTMAEACSSAWKWQSQNPAGYAETK